MDMDILTLADFRDIFKLSLDNLADLIGNRDNQTVGKAARGAISCTSWTINADYSTAKIKEILDRIDTQLAEYVYRKYVRQKTADKTKEYIIKSLLAQALSYSKEYQKKNTVVVMSVKAKQEFQYISDQFFEKWIHFNLASQTIQTNDSINIINQDSSILSGDAIAEPNNAEQSLHSSLEKFTAEATARKDEIEVVNFAFNQGLRWIFNEEWNGLFKGAYERAKQVNILITDPQVSDIFTKHQCESHSFEVSKVISPMQMWKNYIQSNNLNKISFKISPLPILRHYISFHYEEEKDSTLYVGFYTYGRAPLDKNQFFITSFNEQYYDSYRNEFNYLWNIATDINEI